MYLNFFCFFQFLPNPLFTWYIWGNFTLNPGNDGEQISVALMDHSLTTTFGSVKKGIIKWSNFSHAPTVWTVLLKSLYVYYVKLMIRH